MRAVPLDRLRGARVTPTVLCPATADASAAWDAAHGRLTVCLARPGTAVLLRLDGRAPLPGRED